VWLSAGGDASLMLLLLGLLVVQSFQCLCELVELSSGHAGEAGIGQAGRVPP
jgi:hypothetical protein